jgi:hypothetical protein
VDAEPTPDDTEDEPLTYDPTVFTEPLGDLVEERSGMVTGRSKTSL